MIVSLSWLRDYVPIEWDTDRLANALTMIGLEVDSVTDRYDHLKQVRVGRIASVRPHPNADKLKICEVAVGDETLSVVCGAPNVTEGMLSPVALPGTQFADGTVLEKSTIRGEISEGMLCSEIELGLGADRSGIMNLGSGHPLGASIKDALGLSDAVIEVDLTPNRPDCLSLIGIAREVAAIQNAPLTYPEIPPDASDGNIGELTSVIIEDPDHCPRYTAKLVLDITVGPSPFWLQDRLMSVGLRPINNIVDVTNFVMMETGQPLHAFDYDLLTDNRIVVRTAKEGEPFVSLDGKEHRLSGDMLMICDGEKPVGIAGIMGGLNSEINDRTTRVLIESAYFNPVSIRRTAKTLGMGTDASHRFERGVDPAGTMRANERSARLIAELGGGNIAGGAIDANPIPYQGGRILFSVGKTNRVLGTNLNRDAMADILKSIEFSIETIDDDVLGVVAPTFRVDVSRPEDLMEEIARLSGYNNIPETTPLIPAEGRPLAMTLRFREKLRELMVGFGFSEAIAYSFAARRSGDMLNLPKDDPRRRTLAILNPLTEDQAVMRTSLIPGLLDALGRNVARQNRTVRLFEVGKIFISRGRNELPEEIEMVAGLWFGSRQDGSWLAEEAPCDFYDMKGVVESLLAGFNVPRAEFTAMPDSACNYTRSGHSAEILIDGEVIGIVGEVSSGVLASFDLEQPAFIFEIDCHQLMNRTPTEIQARPLPKFPATARDITLIVDRNLESVRILDNIRNTEETLVESVHLFDVFEGDPIPQGKKSLSFRITYRSSSQTLEDEQVNRIHRDISEKLIQSFKAELPG
ncbi:Phenylalanyl-tRNA synthetase beta chain (EC [Olavius algarvensis associated proteobacterium Delta 3]|nr:Phenylalanyl-tRNA synthetase beta chain (EC [Olavius algarvensis associated proteobacterium Delta 3]